MRFAEQVQAIFRVKNVVKQLDSWFMASGITSAITEPQVHSVFVG